jgi:hypothetical protein
MERDPELVEEIETDGSTSSTTPRSEHPAYEKLVWQGEWDDERIRVRIVKRTEEAPVRTVIERFVLGTEGRAAWLELYGWSGPRGDDGCDQFTKGAFIEGMIDLMGRPEWDTRRPTTSVYPYKLVVQVCKDDNGAGG